MRTGPSIRSTGRTLAGETWWSTKPGRKPSVEAAAEADLGAEVGMGAAGEPVVAVAVEEVVVGIEAAIVAEIVATGVTDGKSVEQFCVS